MEQITLDLIPKGSLPVLHASQYDDGRQWKVNLKENGEDYTLTDETIVLGVRKGDGCAVTCAVAIESGKKYVILTSTEQMCAVAGQNLAELQITKDNTKIGTLNFILQVERDPLAAGISSGTEIHDLQHQVDECVHTAFETIGASGLPYDNTESGLTADNVQQAIDEVNEKASSLPSYVYTKEETDALLADKADKATLEADYYDKAETDALLADKADASTLGDYYTKSETNTKLSGKADKGSVYTTAQVNTLLGDKADKSDLDNYYTKSQTNSLLNDKANKANVYDKNYLNGIFDQIDNAFTDVNMALGQKANSSDVYNKTYIDTALSAKANANAVYTKAETDAKVAGLIDDTSTASNKTWSSEKTNAELEALLPVDEESGAVANFDTDVVLPLIDVKAEIKAVETGTGAKSPSNPYVISGFTGMDLYQRGANLWDEQWEIGMYSTSTGAKESASTVIRCKNPIAVKGGASYYFKNSAQGVAFQIYKYDSNMNYLGYISYGSGVKNLESEVAFITFNLNTAYGTTYNNDISINYPSTDTTYHAYNPNSSVFPVSWQTEAGEVFGGEVDVKRGKLKVTHKAKVKLRDLGYWNYSASANHFYVNNINDVFQKTDWNTHIGLCECYNEGRVGNNQGDDLAFAFYNTTIYLRDNNYSDAQSWLNAVGDYYITYQLATPVEYDLTPQQISALLGVNNVWSDTGDTTVDYKLGIQAYIDKKIAEVQALVL